MTQQERIVKYLDEFGTITALEAMRDLGVYRLASRIYDIKEQGIDIDKKMIQVSNRYGEYTKIAQYHLENQK